MSRPDASFLNYLGTPVFVLEPDLLGRPIYQAVNDAWCIAAKRSADDVIGLTAREIFAARQGEIVYQRHLDVARSGKKQTYDVMLPIGGNSHSVRTTLTPVSDADGNVVRLFGTSIDKTAELEVQELHASVQAATSEIEDFIALAAHDLRAPMRNVRSLADMLREDFQDHGDGKLELIGLLEEVAVKSTNLISEILSHAQATAAENQRVTFGLDQLCSEIFAVLDPFESHTLAVGDEWIDADKVAIQIALRNLLDNAIKHSGRKVVDLRVSAEQRDSETIEITVQDNGHGFKDPAIAFLDGGKLRVESGFGLLGIRRLIDARGGTISANNLADRDGSVVRFTLPGRIVEPPECQADDCLPGKTSARVADCAMVMSSGARKPAFAAMPSEASSPSA